MTTRDTSVTELPSAAGPGPPRGEAAGSPLARSRQLVRLPGKPGLPGRTVVLSGRVGGARVRVEVSVAGGDEVEEQAALWEWLLDEPELRGTLAREPVPIEPGRLGAGAEMLTVALGSGGAVAVLARSLSTWLRTRRPGLTLTVTANGRSARLKTENVDERHVEEALAILREIATGGDEA